MIVQENCIQEEHTVRLAQIYVFALTIHYEKIRVVIHSKMPDQHHKN